MMFVLLGYRDIGIFPATVEQMNLPEIKIKIKISDKFSTLGIALGTCGLIIDNAIMELVNNLWADSNKARAVQKL